MKLFWKQWQWTIMCMLGLILIVGFGLVSFRLAFRYTGVLARVDGDICEVMSLSDGTVKSFTTAEYCAEYGVSVLSVSDDEEGSTIYRHTPEITVCIATVPVTVHGVPVEMDDAVYFLGSETDDKESAYLYCYRNEAMERVWDKACHSDSGVIALGDNLVLVTEYRGIRDRFYVDGVLTALNVRTGETKIMCEGSLPCYDPEGQRLLFRMRDYNLGVYDFAGQCVIQPESSPAGSLMTAPVYSHKNDALVCLVETPDGYLGYCFCDFSNGRSIMIDMDYKRLQGWELTERVDTPDYWID